MNIGVLGPIADILDTVVKRVWPDPAEQAKAQLELAKLAQSGEFKQAELDLQAAIGQLDINKAEALSSDRFVSGWRPFIGWVCGTAFASHFVVGPWATYLATAIWDKTLKFPSMDWDQMAPVLLGMLGLGAYRSWEKVKGTK